METSLYNWIKRQAHASVYADRAYCLRLTATDFSPGQPVLSGAMFFFLLPLNGSVRLLSVTDEPFASLRPGQMVVLSPSMEARLGTPEGNFSALCLLLEPLFFDSLSASQQVYSQLVMLSPGGSPVPFAIGGAALSCLRRPLSLFLPHPGSGSPRLEGMARHLCDFCLLQIADVLASAGQRRQASPTSHSQELFRDFRKLLLEHYRTRHGLDFYADALSVSTVYLSRIVKKLTGHTVYYHIGELLCADARKLLTTTDLNVKNIADTLGFADQSSFGKFFRRHMGVPPSLFRQASASVSAPGLQKTAPAARPAEAHPDTPASTRHELYK